MDSPMRMAWWRGTPVIEEGLIRLVTVGGKYNPFDFYFPRGNKRSLYLEFASLNPKDQADVLAFVSRFGLLGTAGRKAALAHEQRLRDSIANLIAGLPVETTIKTYSSALNKSEDLEDFGAAVEAMQLTLRLWRALQEGDKEALRDLVAPINSCRETMQVVRPDGTFGEGPEAPPLPQWACAKEDEDSCRAWLSMRLNFELSHSQPRLEFKRNSQPVQIWASRDLLASMYLMLALDMTGHFPGLLCCNETCNNFFIPTRERQIYCSEACGDSQRLRRFRRKAKGGSTDS